MITPHDERQRDDHYFAAVQRWLLRNAIVSVALACPGGQDAPLGNRKRPAVEAPGCLNELPLHRLVDLWLAGIREIAVVPGACRAGQDGTDVTQPWFAALGDLIVFTTTDVAPTRQWTWSLSPTRVPVDRRGLLGLSRAQPSWPSHEPGTNDHTRLLSSMKAAGMTSLGTPPPGLALAASGCTACGVCVAACPHDALSLSVDGDETALLHAPEACQGERQCVSLCPVEALSAHGPLPWADVLEGPPRVLATLEMAVCTRCQARFPARESSQWCEPCRIRRSDPFGSHLSAAAIALLKQRGRDRPS